MPTDYLYRRLRDQHVVAIYKELKKDPGAKSLPALLYVLPGQVVNGKPVKTREDVVKHLAELK